MRKHLRDDMYVRPQTAVHTCCTLFRAYFIIRYFFLFSMNGVLRMRRNKITHQKKPKCERPFRLQNY